MAMQSPNLNVMIRAAEKAGRSLVRDFGEVEHLQVSQKGPGDFVSAADKRSEQIIHEELSKARPNFGFMMEESGKIDGSEDARFIIDPLDGTMNFLHGLPHWCISIALEEAGEITAGVIYDPVKDEMFKTEKGGGAFSGRQRLRVSGRGNMDAAFIATGAPRRSIPASGDQFLKEYEAMQKAGASLRRFGAAALDLAYVAAGRYEGFWERHLNIWDIAAGYLMVRESGGFVCDVDQHNKTSLESGNILAGNQEISTQMKKILKAV